MYDELTSVDIKKMEEEITYRRVELAPVLMAEMKRTREFGDLSENAEYKEAKREKRKNERVYAPDRCDKRRIESYVLHVLHGNSVTSGKEEAYAENAKDGAVKIPLFLGISEIKSYPALSPRFLL